MSYSTFRGLPCKDLRLTRRGRKTLLNSSPKWFRMATDAHGYIVGVNDNLYGFEVFTNDGRKGCLGGKVRLFKSIQMSLIEIKRRRR